MKRELQFNGEIDDFSISLDNMYVVYEGDQDVYDQIELFGVRTKEEPICFPIKSGDKTAIICF